MWSNEYFVIIQIYHFFGFLWTTQFLIAILQTTIAGAIAAWYWVREKGVSAVIQSNPSEYRIHEYTKIYTYLLLAIA